MKPIKRTRRVVIVKLRAVKGWALSNFGNVWSFHRTRRRAIEQAEADCGQPWRELRASMEVWKAELRPRRDRPTKGDVVLHVPRGG